MNQVISIQRVTSDYVGMVIECSEIDFQLLKGLIKFSSAETINYDRTKHEVFVDGEKVKEIQDFLSK